MKIKEIMTTGVISVSPDTSIPEVAELIFQNRFHGLPVTEGKKLVGLVTEDDFFLKDQDGTFLPAYIQFLKDTHQKTALPEGIKRKAEKIVAAKVREIMTQEVRTVSPEEEVEKVLEIIKETKFTSFPVVDEKKNLLGIVTLSDVLGTVRHGTSRIKNALAAEKGGGLYNSVRQLQSYWKDEMIFVSRKNVRTWKGGTIIGIFLFFLVIFLWFFNEKNPSDCGLDGRSELAATCQEFSYSEWGPCQSDGLQKRELLSRKPLGCEGGIPALIQKCQP